MIALIFACTQPSPIVHAAQRHEQCTRTCTGLGQASEYDAFDDICTCADDAPVLDTTSPEEK